MVNEELANSYLRRAKKCIQPPKWHYVGSIIDQHIEKYPSEVRDKLRELNKEAKWLRSQREIAFYEDMDLIPEELYTKEDALKAIDIAKGYLQVAETIWKRF